MRIRRAEPNRGRRAKGSAHGRERAFGVEAGMDSRNNKNRSKRARIRPANPCRCFSFGGRPETCTVDSVWMPLLAVVAFICSDPSRRRGWQDDKQRLTRECGRQYT